MENRPSSFAIVRLLLRAARQGTRGRLRSVANRRGKSARGIGYGFAVFITIALQAGMAGIFLWMAGIANVVSIEQSGVMVVSDRMIEAIRTVNADGLDLPGQEGSDGVGDTLDSAIKGEARQRANERGGDAEQWHRDLVRHYLDRHAAGFMSDDAAGAGGRELTFRVLTAFLVCWLLSLVLQGEGLNVDTSRRRHPMWEWYLAFPITQPAVFIAEALTPAFSSPLLLASPILIAVLIGWTSSSVVAGIAALPISIPLLLAATLWAKALEVLVTLRSSVRNRSAWLLLMAAAGYVALIGPFLMLQSRSLAYGLAGAALPWLQATPGSEWLLDAGNPSGWLRAMTFSTVTGLLLAVPASLLMRFAAARGLESGFGSTEKLVDSGSFELQGAGLRGFLKDPLLRKERLWLRRDRGALLQLIGVPLLMLSVQFFNFHNILRSVDMTWNKLAGVIVILGAMLLASAGPRTLISEGPALLLSMSWPRSIEDMLRMKVRVLFFMVTAMVWACLGIAIWLFPGDFLKLIGVGLLWLVFGLAVAEKSVTLIRAPSQSGEPEAVPRGQVFAANVGNSTLGVALLTSQWQLAFAAIAMNWVFAGALWQGFRQRLAFLFDPQSEPELRPPTILSSVLAIVALLEFGALIALPFMFALGKESAPFARAIGYGIAAIGVCIGITIWHKSRSVYLSDVLTMDEETPFVAVRASLFAVACGMLLAIIGFGYQYLLAHAPWQALRDMMEQSTHFFANSPNARVAYTIMAVGIAPWLEEFLFRGLMFRAMLPQWGLTRAALASAAFFTALHPWPFWPIIFALGFGNALLYARCRSLLPCILLHATYSGLLMYLTF